MNRQVRSVSEDGMNFDVRPELLRRFSDEDNVGVGMAASMQRLLPSGDQRKLRICSESKVVICRPREPSSGCTQRLSTPFSRIGRPPPSHPA